LANGLGIAEAWRTRFSELVKAEIAHTMAGEGEMRDELRYLIEVVR
jgi:hypothetical protein